MDGAALTLEKCSESAIAGDGRDVFSLQAGGELVSAGAGLCAKARASDGADTSDVVLGACDGASKWEFAGNGQLKLVGELDLCLSQVGINAGIADVASKAAVMATSTANGLAHGAFCCFMCFLAYGLRRNLQRALLDGVRSEVCPRAGASMAVDDNMNTFWASKFDHTSDPVEFVIDLGEVQRLSSIDILWEFPAKSFAIALSQDGLHYNEAFETDANILRTSRASLGMKAARKVRISMYEVSARCMFTFRDSAT